MTQRLSHNRESSELTLLAYFDDGRLQDGHFALRWFMCGGDRFIKIQSLTEKQVNA